MDAASLLDCPNGNPANAFKQAWPIRGTGSPGLPTRPSQGQALAIQGHTNLLFGSRFFRHETYTDDALMNVPNVTGVA
jgi:hypothetical protein